MNDAVLTECALLIIILVCFLETPTGGGSSH